MSLRSKKLLKQTSGDRCKETCDSPATSHPEWFALKKSVYKLFMRCSMVLENTGVTNNTERYHKGKNVHMFEVYQRSHKSK